MIYLIIGVDRNTLAPWHENIGARDVTSARKIALAHAEVRGIDLAVAAALGPSSSLLDADEPAPRSGAS